MLVKNGIIYLRQFFPLSFPKAMWLFGRCKERVQRGCGWVVGTGPVNAWCCPSRWLSPAAGSGLSPGARSHQGGRRLPLLQHSFTLCSAAEAPISAQNLG